MPSKITTLPLMNEYVQCLHNITFNVSREINQNFLLISILYPYVFKSWIGSKVPNQKPNCLIDCWVFFFNSSVSQKSKYIMPDMSMFSQIIQCLTFQFQHMTYCRPLKCFWRNYRHLWTKNINETLTSFCTQIPLFSNYSIPTWINNW